jgi:hypothetical protein
MNRERQPTPPSAESAAPARNFTLTTAERVRAAVAGPPAWSLRLRRIERLEEEIVTDLVELAARAGAPVAALPPALEAKLSSLNGLVAKHNEYYPIEANLPSNPRTREMMDGGRPWQLMEPRTAEALLAAARARWPGLAW